MEVYYLCCYYMYVRLQAAYTGYELQTYKHLAPGRFLLIGEVEVVLVTCDKGQNSKVLITLYGYSRGTSGHVLRLRHPCCTCLVQNINISVKTRPCFTLVMSLQTCNHVTVVANATDCGLPSVLHIGTASPVCQQLAESRALPLRTIV